MENYTEQALPIPSSHKERLVIIGAGFAGIRLARQIDSKRYQVVLLDKHNYHQFQPLFYQVAMSGLEPSAIVFPVRKAFQSKPNFYFRALAVERIDTENQMVHTNMGYLLYNHLVIAIGADTNFFGNAQIAKLTVPMKSISEALYLRNRILADLEDALHIADYQKRQSYIDIVIVGGGATGVEIAGALAEMRKYILPKDYKELNPAEIDIYLVDAGTRLLAGMSEKASAQAEQFLLNMGVIIKKQTIVKQYDGETVLMSDGSSIASRKVIWAAGVTGNKLEGLPAESLAPNNRLWVDESCCVKGLKNVYAIGDIAYMPTAMWPKGHPQVAQVALQMGAFLAKKLNKNQIQPSFMYKDYGSMATIGRNKAVADLPGFNTAGFFAWVIWLWVHLLSLIGVKNKFIVFLNWVINYFTYDPSLRLLIKPKIREELPKN